jgi:hypothetical protein
LLALAPLLSEADEGSMLPHHPTVVHGGVEAYFVGGLHGPTDGFAVVAVEQRLMHALAVEASIGQGFGNVHDTGTQVGLAVRTPLLATEDGRHKLFAGVGATLALGGEYGAVPFMRAELGYELRLALGLDLAAAVGPAMALGTSRTPTAQNPGWFSFGEGPFHAGDIGPWVRVAAGWAF